MTFPYSVEVIECNFFKSASIQIKNDKVQYFSITRSISFNRVIFHFNFNYIQSQCYKSQFTIHTTSTYG